MDTVTVDQVLNSALSAVKHYIHLKGGRINGCVVVMVPNFIIIYSVSDYVYVLAFILNWI